MAKEKKEVTSLHEYIIESAARKGKTPADWFDAMVMQMNGCHLASHIGKFTNPDIKTTVCSHSKKVAGYVTTGGSNCSLDILTPAQYLGSASLLLSPVTPDKNVLEAVITRDKELEKELELLSLPIEKLQKKVQEMLEDSQKEPEATDTHLRQVYFPIAEGKYHLLSVMPSSSLALEMYRRIRAINGHKIGCYNKKSETYGQPCEEITELTKISFGGTKSLNISALNSRCGGKTYLLSSLPPSLPARKIRLPKSDFFRESIWYKQQSSTLYRLHAYMKQDRNTMEIRQAIHDLMDEIISAVLLTAYQIRAGEIGWSEKEAYSQLPTAQKIWLDDVCMEERLETSWTGEIAAAFARWVVFSYERLLGEEAVSLGDAEWRNIKNQIEIVLKDEVRYES